MSRSTSPGFPQSDNACPSWFWRPRSADILIATAKIHNTRRVRCAVSVCVVVLSVRDPPQRCQVAPSRHPSVPTLHQRLQDALNSLWLSEDFKAEGPER